GQEQQSMRQAIIMFHYKTNNIITLADTFQYEHFTNAKDRTKKIKGHAKEDGPLLWHYLERQQYPLDMREQSTLAKFMMLGLNNGVVYLVANSQSLLMHRVPRELLLK
ncbi:hypothetical protein ACJX0J_037644, partial [Zea mays]